MIWHVAGLVWILQIFFWGLGLTLLIVPGRWRRFWPAFCGPVGLGLQSVTVWIAAHTLLPGTDSYAAVSTLLPAGFLLAAWLSLRRRVHFGRLLGGTWRWGLVFALMTASLVATLRPFANPPARLTSMAISSCDAADYAAGARVFKEFASGDRSGFLGSSDIARTLSVDNFFDFWLRINHFSPSAIIALNATLFGRQPYELTSLFGVVLLALNLPSVFWLARSAFRFRPAGSLGVTAIYAVSPILGYAAYQTALGQLIAAPAVAMLTWTGWQAYRGPGTWRALAGWSGLLLVGNWLLFGGYNFFILFAYIPLFTLIGVKTLWERSGFRALRWTVLIGANLLLCTLLFPERVISVVERFRLFNKTAFGWAIPGFWPAGWYGWFADASFTPNAAWWSGALVLAALGAAVGTGVLRGSRGRRQTGLLAVCCTLPIFFGYWYLLRKERVTHDHSSYDAFKLFTVFYPGILISLCLWLGGGAANVPLARVRQIAAGILWALLLVANAVGLVRLYPAVRNSPLFVSADMAALSRIERLADVESVNINLVQIWDCLWANCFLLHKAQFLPMSTYEGRAISELRARWDLSPRLPSARLQGESDPLASNRTYTLVDRGNRFFVEARFDQGWYSTEGDRVQIWRWGQRLPRIRVKNPHADSLPASLGFAVATMNGRHLRLCMGERVLWEGMIGTALREVEGVPLDLPPGTTYLRLESSEALDQAPGDSRSLTFMLHRFVIDVGVPSAPQPAGTTGH